LLNGTICSVPTVPVPTVPSDVDGSQTKTTSDSFGNKIKEEKRSSSTDTYKTTAEYTYDTNNRLETQIQYAADDEAKCTLTTNYYDNLGRQTKVEVKNGTATGATVISDIEYSYAIASSGTSNYNLICVTTKQKINDSD